LTFTVIIIIIIINIMCIQAVLNLIRRFILYRCETWTSNVQRNAKDKTYTKNESHSNST